MQTVAGITPAFHRRWMILIVAATLLAYLPAIRAGWIWDDNHHVTQNVDLLTLNGLKELWLRPGAVPQYYPLTHTTFWIEHHLWGNQPLGYHLDNVLLHIANAIMVGLILRRLNVPGYALAAALFALHPVEVESVAWVTERKNVLSGFFYLTALWAAIDVWKIDREKAQGTSSLGVWGYVLCLCLFALALLSKTVTSSLPAVILILVWWKNGRVTVRQAAATLPLFVMGAVMGSMTAWMEKHVVGANGPEWNLTEIQRVLIAFRAFWFYLGKLLWPHPLIFVYPRWNINPWRMEPWLYPAAVVALATLLRKHRAAMIAFLFFAVTLIPALGFANVYPMRYTFVADHYQYLAGIGPIALIAAWIRRPMIGVPIALLLGLLTFRQSFIYTDDVSLWRDVVTKDHRSVIGHTNLAAALLDHGQIDAAAVEARRALESGGNLVEAQIEPGVIAEARGNLPLAAQIYRATAVRWPQSPLPYWHLALVERRMGDVADATTDLLRAIDYLPNPAAADEQLGEIELGRHDSVQAAAFFKLALEADPDLIDAHNNLAAIALAQESTSAAEEECQAALAIDPDNASACNNMGIVQLRQGNTDAAAEWFRHALRSDPGFTMAKDNLARLGR
jgi:protein O-mannosyl-transferase